MVNRGEPIRVFLVDDHEHVLWGLGKLIDGQWPRMMVAGTAMSVAQLLVGLRARRADVVLLDVYLGSENSLDRLAEIRASGAAVVVLTGSRDPEVHRRATDNQADKVVLKEDPADILLREIECAHFSRLAERAGR